MYPSDTSKVQLSWTIIHFVGSDSLQYIFFFCISLVERSAQIPASLYFFDNFHLPIQDGVKWHILFITGLQHSYCNILSFLVLVFIDHPDETFLCLTEVWQPITPRFFPKPSLVNPLYSSTSLSRVVLLMILALSNHGAVSLMKTLNLTYLGSHSISQCSSCSQKWGLRNVGYPSTQEWMMVKPALYLFKPSRFDS